MLRAQFRASSDISSCGSISSSIRVFHVPPRAPGQLHRLRRHRQTRLPYWQCLAYWLYYACRPCRFYPAQNPNPYPYHKTRGAPAALLPVCMPSISGSGKKWAGSTVQKIITLYRYPLYWIHNVLKCLSSLAIAYMLRYRSFINSTLFSASPEAYGKMPHGIYLRRIG